MNLSFSVLQSANMKRCDESFHLLNEWSKRDWALAVAGETGEMCNLVKKQRRGDKITNDEIAEEVADIVIYCDLLCTRLGINLSDAVRSKFNKVSFERKSPISI